jgi:hypothetical protein
VRFETGSAARNRSVHAALTAATYPLTRAWKREPGHLGRASCGGGHRLT